MKLAHTHCTKFGEIWQLSAKDCGNDLRRLPPKYENIQKMTKKRLIGQIPFFFLHFLSVDFESWIR